MSNLENHSFYLRDQCIIGNIECSIIMNLLKTKQDYWKYLLTLSPTVKVGAGGAITGIPLLGSTEDIVSKTENLKENSNKIEIWKVSFASIQKLI